MYLKSGYYKNDQLFYRDSEVPDLLPNFDPYNILFLYWEGMCYKNTICNCSYGFFKEDEATQDLIEYSWGHSAIDSKVLVSEESLNHLKLNLGLNIFENFNIVITELSGEYSSEPYLTTFYNLELIYI